MSNDSVRQTRPIGDALWCIHNRMPMPCRILRSIICRDQGLVGRGNVFDEPDPEASPETLSRVFIRLIRMSANIMETPEARSQSGNFCIPDNPSETPGGRDRHAIPAQFGVSGQHLPFVFNPRRQHHRYTNGHRGALANHPGANAQPSENSARHDSGGLARDHSPWPGTRFPSPVRHRHRRKYS